MKIVSRFSDAYDYEQSVDRKDSVTYVRNYASGKVTNTSPSGRIKPLGDVPNGLYLKVGEKLTHIPLTGANRVHKDTVSYLQDYKYCPTFKRLEKVTNAANTHSFWGGVTHHGMTYLVDTVGCEHTGKLFVNKKMIEFIKRANFNVVMEPEVLEYLTGEVGLMVVHGYDVVKYVNDFSLQASGLYEAYVTKFGGNISSLIDMSLSTQEDIGRFTLTDKEKLTRKGFDSKVSFRNRKAVYQ